MADNRKVKAPKEVTLMPCILLVPHGAHRFDVIVGHVEPELVELQDVKMERKHIAEIINAAPRLLGDIDTEKL